MVTRLGRWLWPALMGPVLASWMLLGALYLAHDREARVLALLVATWLGGVQGLVLLLVDAMLLRMQLRLLPMGRRGWLMGLAAPPLTAAIFIALWPRGRLEPSLELAMASMLASAVALRLVFSPRFNGTRA